jgi:hypothetical protein
LNQNATKVYGKNDIEQASYFLSAIAAALNPDDGLEDRRVEHLKLQTIPPSLLNKNR